MNKLLLIFSIAVCSFTSCGKDTFNYESDSTYMSTSGSIPQRILYKEDCEGKIPFLSAEGIENSGLPYALQFEDGYARFEIRKDQPLVGSSKKVRSEVTIIKGDDKRFTPKGMWYSYYVYFPSVGMEYDDTRDCITQWYEDGSDETTVRVEKGKVFLEVLPAKGSKVFTRYDLFSDKETKGSVTEFSDMEKDVWHTFTYHFVHSKGSDGLIEVWRDDVKIHNIPGRNMHLKYPKWKIGLYKASFLNKSSERDYRVIRFDNIVVAN